MKNKKVQNWDEFISEMVRDRGNPSTYYRKLSVQ
jgi:hypothetical protein